PPARGPAATRAAAASRPHRSRRGHTRFGGSHPGASGGGTKRASTATPAATTELRGDARRLRNESFTGAPPLKRDWLVGAVAHSFSRRLHAPRQDLLLRNPGEDRGGVCRVL